jgi:putative tricarboxylic transport membrane protein
VEENFGRAMLISNGDLRVFVERPISATFLVIAVLLVVAQIIFRMRMITRTRAMKPAAP